MISFNCSRCSEVNGLTNFVGVFIARAFYRRIYAWVLKMVAITGAIESVGARVEFLPEYSPDFSPIEPFWSKVKKAVRDFGPRTVIKLFAALKQAFATVTLKDILGFFAHCGYKVAPT